MVKIRKRLMEVLETSEGNDILSKVYDITMMMVIVISIIPLLFKNQTPVLLVIDKVTISIFIIDYLLRWFTYDIKSGRKGLSAFIRYPFSFYAIIDLLSILPSLTILNQAFRLLKVLRLLRTFRVLKILRYSKSFSIILSVIKCEKIALSSVGVMALGYVFISALVMFSVEPGSFNTLFDALYWATTALTTVGYGDIYPVTNIGKVVSMVSSVLGIAFVALPSGIITAGYLKELSKKNDE